ncbi:MAG: DUF3750 domain-containing protein, partial [Geminicoccaceae bacterium]
PLVVQRSMIWRRQSGAMGSRRIGATALLIAATVACSPEDLSGERDFDDVAVVGLAPGPDDNRESIVQVYAARSYEPLPRLVSVHTWIAYRQAGEEKYTIYEAHRFQPRLSGRAVRTCQKYYPDRKWHGAEPTLLFEIRGEAADRAIEGIEDAVETYDDVYRLWPGPNSNTLVAELARSVDELKVDLPPTAIGKDFLPGWRVLAPVPSGTGWQVSFLGMLGLLVALEEGIELNLFGAVFGLDLNPPALKLPIVGRLGFAQGRRPDPSDAERLRHIPPETRCH